MQPRLGVVAHVFLIIEVQFKKKKKQIISVHGKLVI